MTGPLTVPLAVAAIFLPGMYRLLLPGWLARRNKAIFGTLFVVNELIVLWRWLVRP